MIRRLRIAWETTRLRTSRNLGHRPRAFDRLLGLAEPVSPRDVPDLPLEGGYDVQRAGRLPGGRLVVDVVRREPHVRSFLLISGSSVLASFEKLLG